MKRFIKILILSLVVIAAFYIVFKIHKGGNSIISVGDEKLKVNLKYKGLEQAEDFTFDDNGNYFIAFKNKIQFIGKNGNSYDILKDNTLNIDSIEYQEGKLYFSSDTRVKCFDLKDKSTKEIVIGLPNYGDYKDSLIKIKDRSLFISIGSATNSGVVGKDNIWLKDNTYNHDVSPKDVTVRGKNFGSENTGAFSIYKTKNLSGQIIPGHFPGNACVMKYNLSDGAFETFAWGIRNIKGMDIDSDNNLIASVGGMEDRGLRPVKGDQDYIYVIKRGNWYGWPDYSGGDPINSPKFKGASNERIQFIFDNHPTTNPPAPLYQHNNLSTLGSLAVDSMGLLSEKNCIYFYDMKDNIIYSINKSGVLLEKLYFDDDNMVKSIKFDKSSLCILESNKGCLYTAYNILNSSHSNAANNIMYYLLGVFVLAIALILIKWKN